MKLTMGHGDFVMLGMVLACLCRCEAFIASSVAGLHRSSPAANAATSPSSLPPWSSTRTRMMLAPFAGAAAAHLISSSPLNPDHLVLANSQPTHLVAVKEIREGIYGPYEVEVTEKAPETDFGISTFKKKEDTEEGRDKYVSVLAVLLAGSFIIPMVQYWWYVRDDDRPIK